MGLFEDDRNVRKSPQSKKLTVGDKLIRKTNKQSLRSFDSTKATVAANLNSKLSFIDVDTNAAKEEQGKIVPLINYLEDL